MKQRATDNHQFPSSDKRKEKTLLEGYFIDVPCNIPEERKQLYGTILYLFVIFHLIKQSWNNIF